MTTSNDFFFLNLFLKWSCDKLTSLMVCGEFLATRIVFVIAARIGALAFRCKEGTCHLLLGDISFPAVSSSERSIFFPDLRCQRVIKTLKWKHFLWHKCQVAEEIRLRSHFTCVTWSSLSDLEVQLDCASNHECCVGLWIIVSDIEAEK